MRWRCVSIRAMRRAQTEQGCGDYPGASKNCAPDRSPRLFGPSTHEGSPLSGSCLCQHAQEGRGFSGHTTSNLDPPKKEGPLEFLHEIYDPRRSLP